MTTSGMETDTEPYSVAVILRMLELGHIDESEAKRLLARLERLSSSPLERLLIAITS